MFVIFGVNQKIIDAKARKKVKQFVGTGKSRRPSTADEQNKMLSDAMAKLAVSQPKVQLSCEFSSPDIAKQAMKVYAEQGINGLEIRVRVLKQSTSKKGKVTMRKVWQEYTGLETRAGGLLC